MPKRVQKAPDYTNPPESLDDIIYFGLKLDDEQKAFRDAIWDENKDIVFVNAAAGSGKTLIAVATSVLLCHYKKFDDIVYVMHAVGDAQGFLPGTISEKSSVWFEPLYQALIKCNEWPDRVVKNSMTDSKNDLAYITAITDSYLRGSNIGGGDHRSILIVDEAQNYGPFDLRKVLTRACEGTKVIVIGHTLQCDLPGGARSSGFTSCMEHFRAKQNERFAFCELHTCHRSLIAQVADEPWKRIISNQYPKKMAEPAKEEVQTYE